MRVSVGAVVRAVVSASVSVSASMSASAGVSTGAGVSTSVGVSTGVGVSAGAHINATSKRCVSMNVITHLEREPAVSARGSVGVSREV